MGALQAKVGKVREIRRRGDGDPLLEIAKEADRAALSDDIEIVIENEGDESSFRISRDNPRFGMWSEYLQSREKTETPVYLRVEEGEVREVLPTYHYLVDSVELVDDGSGLESLVSFRQSPALYTLNGKHEKFEEFLELLREAAKTKKAVQVSCLLTSRKIVYVQYAPETLSPQDASSTTLIKEEPAPLDTLLRDSDFTHLTISQAIEAFDFLATNPLLHIPFRSPEDGCIERAHLMCRLLREERGLRARKIWNFGSGYSEKATLEVFPGLQLYRAVRWRYHVAPIVSVPTSAEKLLVLDPAMFPEWPVSVEMWLQAQNDPATQPFQSSDMALWRLPNGEERVGDFTEEVNKNLSDRTLSWKEKRMEFLFPKLQTG